MLSKKTEGYDKDIVVSETGNQSGSQREEEKRRYITEMSHILVWRSAVCVHNVQRAKEQSESFF